MLTGALLPPVASASGLRSDVCVRKWGYRYTLLWDKGVAAADPEAFARLSSGTEKRFKVANLEPGRLYRLCVTATNRVGQGGMSEVAT